MEENVDDVFELKRFNNELDAELLVDNLKTHGVYAFIKRDDPSTMGILRGAKVAILESDKEEALELLKAFGL